MDNKRVVAGASLYEINKNLILSRYKPKTKEEILEATSEMTDELFKKAKGQYFMLLCKYDNNYTLFNLQDKNYKEAQEALYDCIKNRGNMLHYNKTINKDGYEIWIKDLRDVWGYLLFPCDNLVVEA